MEIILTNKNSELLIFEGYAYIKHRTLADNSLSWRCGQSSCNGRVRTKDDSVEIVKDHCHFPDPADIEKRKFRKTLKDRAAVSDVTPRQTIFATQRDVNRETAVHLPSYSANQQAVNRVRREKRPKMAEPTFADWLWTTTGSTENPRWRAAPSSRFWSPRWKLGYCVRHVTWIRLTIFIGWLVLWWNVLDCPQCFLSDLYYTRFRWRMPYSCCLRSATRQKGINLLSPSQYS